MAQTNRCPEEEPIVVSLDTLTALSVIANIQLASRHPKNTGPSAEVAEWFARILQEEVAKRKPEIAVMLEMGWNPELDIDDN